ncbi:MAG: hypothetical protein MJ066_03235 [Clostridia bacterium]|nr:hypothetical protein [Clostridia bacterium]
MKKAKSTILFSIICAIIAFLIVMTFVRFPIGKTKNYNSLIGAIELDYDVKGGNVYTLTLDEDSRPIDDIDAVVNQVKDRLAELDYQTYSVKAVNNVNDSANDYSIVICAQAGTNEYGESNTDQLTSDINAVARYGSLKVYGGTEENPSVEILDDVDKVISNAKYVGSVVSAEKEYFNVNITFTKEAFNKLNDLIKSNDSYYLRISVGDTDLLNGSIKDAVFDKYSLQVNLTTESYARQIAMQIRTGGLDYKFDVENNDYVVENNDYIVLTVLIASILLLSIIAFIVLYKGYGIVAGLSLISFMLLEMILLVAIPGIKLSISGFVGIILSIALVVDGLIILAKRIKEESENGKMIKPAVKGAFRRTLFPVLNTSIVSAILGLFVFILGSSAIKCFGITFGIGALIACFVNLVLSRVFASLLLPIANFKESFFGLKRNGEAK